MTINYLSSDVVMVGKDHDLTKDTRLHLQNVRNLNVIIEVLDDNNNVLDTIHGIVSDGGINVDGESLVRRTGNLTMNMTDRVLPRSGNLIWITNKIRIYIGIRDNSSILEEDTTHYCIGTFYMGEVNTEISKDGKSVVISLEDYMMKWSVEELEETIVIEAGAPLHIAVANMMNLVGEYNLDIDMTNVDIPSDMEFTAGETIVSVITKLRDLYMDYECYYTVDGVFTFKKMKVQLKDSEISKWVFDKSNDISIGISKKYDFKNVRNAVKVFGRTLTDGSTVSGEYNITDVNNPFHADNIGRRLKVVNESNLFTIEQCESQAVYELYKASNLQETYTIATVPIYFLDVNDLIEVYNEEREAFEKLIINSYSYSFNIDSEMTINASKIYYNSFNIADIPLEFYRALADDFTMKALNYGWFAIPEKVIYEKFGLMAKGGADVRLRFQYQERYGVQAYVTAYPKNRNQIIVVDLADFHSNEGENGVNGEDKGDYADRVIGHEVLHLVMNDDFGAVKTSEIPEWYKEGLAELLHGADERVKNVIVVDGKIDDTKVNDVINNAYRMLFKEKVLGSESIDYASSYILCKIIAMKLKNNNSNFQKFHDTIRVSSNTGLIAFENALVTHVGTLAELGQFLSNNGIDFVKNVMNLNVGTDEVDTGSISGSDYGFANLNAEDVFNNSEANGKYLSNFNVIVEKP